MHGCEGTSQGIEHYLLGIVRHLDGCSLAERSRVAEIGRATVQIDGSYTGAVDGLEGPVREHYIRRRISDKSEVGSCFVLRSATEYSPESLNVGQVSELL